MNDHCVHLVHEGVVDAKPGALGRKRTTKKKLVFKDYLNMIPPLLFRADLQMNYDQAPPRNGFDSTNYFIEYY